MIISIKRWRTAKEGDFDSAARTHDSDGMGSLSQRGSEAASAWCDGKPAASLMCAMPNRGASRDPDSGGTAVGLLNTHLLAVLDFISAIPQHFSDRVRFLRIQFHASDCQQQRQHGDAATDAAQDKLVALMHRRLPQQQHELSSQRRAANLEQLF